MNMEQYVFRKLDDTHLPQLMALQAIMLENLPDTMWYFPSDEGEFLESLHTGYAYGFFENDRLVAFAICIPFEKRFDKSYAKKTNNETKGSYDFCDIMVHPSFR